jgi:signal transduction histidine kinase
VIHQDSGRRSGDHGVHPAEFFIGAVLVLHTLLLLWLSGLLLNVLREHRSIHQEQGRLSEKTVDAQRPCRDLRPSANQR